LSSKSDKLFGVTYEGGVLCPTATTFEEPCSLRNSGTSSEPIYTKLDGKRELLAVKQLTCPTAPVTSILLSGLSSII